MTNRKTTRRALFMSVISLMLCCAMLVGTTFAWFTDEVTSVNNVITAGNLDVELEYAKVVNGQLSGWNTVQGADKIFDPNALWEPGRVEVVYLKVSNLGSLVLKYQLGVNVASEVPGTNVAGDSFKLSDHLVFKTVEMPNDLTTYTDREAVAAAAGTEKGLKDYNGTTTALEVGGVDYVALIVYMPETVGNEANYKTGTDVPTINLGVNLYATQKDAESDSFGPDYDEDADHKSFKVTTADELQAAIDAGETNIALVTDIDLADGEKIVVEAGKTVTINLNGKTVSGAVNKGAGAVLENKGTLTVKGGTIENTAVNGGPAISNSGNLTLEGANVVGAPIDDNDGYPSYALNTSGKLTIEEGTSVSSDRGAIQILGDGETTINGGVFTNNDISRSLTSHVVDLSDDAVNHVLTINGGTFQHLFDETSGGVVICNRTKNTIYVNGGSFSGGNYYGNDNLSDYGYGGTFSVTGGTYTAKPAEKYIASGYKAVESNGKYIVVSENAIVTSDELVAAINTAADGDTLLLAPGEYSLRFTNNTAFNVDNLNIKGMDNAKLTVSSSEAWYGRVQGDNVTFENIHFTSSVGATGKATYNNCTFDDWTICASSGNKETYFDNCVINGTLNTSTDFSSGNTYVTDSTVAKAEFSGAATMYFTNCQIGELISWDMATVLENCVVEKQDLKMEDQKVTTIKTDENGLSLATNTADPDALVLYEVPAAYAADTLKIPEGVTSIGNYAFINNTNVKTVVLPSTVKDLGRGFDSNTSIKKVVLNEGLEKISSRAFRSTTALEEVVIPSSVKVIEDNAFQKSGIKTITIPANVETIGETAFGACGNLETIVIKAENVTIANYIARACANLKKVYIYSNSVTFETGSMYFTNKENGDASGITFYVKDQDMADTLYAAFSTSHSYGLLIKNLEGTSEYYTTLK